MNQLTDESRIIRNLQDAGCDQSTIDRYFTLQKNDCRQEQYRLLYKQRALLLDKIHDTQRMIDCLDYLIYSMKNENKKT